MILTGQMGLRSLILRLVLCIYLPAGQGSWFANLSGHNWNMISYIMNFFFLYIMNFNCIHTGICLYMHKICLEVYTSRKYWLPLGGVLGEG